MFSARAGVEYVRNREIRENIVPVRFREASGVAIDGGECLSVGDGNVIRSDADNGTWETPLAILYDCMSGMLPYFLWTSSIELDQRLRLTFQKIQASVNLARKGPG